MQLVDPTASVSKMFRDGNRLVPYPLLMACLNRLLKDPSALAPHPPSEDLRPLFRAACMAVDLGVADPLERDEERKKEFFEHIYPVWRQSMSAEEFQPYQDILDGKTRQRMEQQREEEGRRRAEEAQEALEKAAEEAAKPRQRLRFVDLTQAALEADEEVQEVADVGISPRPTRPARRRGPELIVEDLTATLMDSVEDLADTLAAGELPIEYCDRRTRRPYARYRFGDENVTVQLLKTGHAYYLLLSYPRGFAELPGAPEAVQAVMVEMGYQQAGPFSFERVQSEFTFKVSVGAHSTNVVQKRGFPFTAAALGRAVEQLHADLVRILTSIKRQLPDRS